MKFFGTNKSVLSTNGMKATARALCAHEDHPERAKIAVMAGLRIDTPQPFYISERQMSKLPSHKKKLGTFEIKSDVTWLFGVCGSGKTETANSVIRDAAASGRRTLMISTNHGAVFRWAEKDLKVFDFRELHEKGSSVFGGLMEALEDPSVNHIFIAVPSLYRNPCFDYMKIIIEEYICASSLEGAVIAIDEVVHLIQDFYPESMTRLRSTGNRLILMDQHPYGKLDIEKTDSVILMKACDSSQITRDLDLQNLIEGEGFLLQEDGALPVLGRYDRFEERKPALTQDTTELIDRIEVALKSRPSSTHIERLELIARCSGYRSWHAAQGAFSRIIGLKSDG